MTNPKLNRATPHCLRAARDTRPGDWVKTPQGNVLRQVENRLQILVKQNKLAHIDEALKELSVIKERMLALHKAAQAPAPKLVKVSLPSLTVAPAIVPALSATDAVLVQAMKEYLSTGDITAIVPNGKFTSQEERDLWQRFVMVDIQKVNGRTIKATKTSNGKAIPNAVLQVNVKAAPGKAVILDNGLISAVMPLTDDADWLAKQFNALYRTAL